MNLGKLYKMQEELDKHIIEKHNIKMSKEELLDNTILALLVEVGELANTTRCFKRWSKKGMMGKEVVLEELADVIHFYLSIGNQLDVRYEYMSIDEELIFRVLKQLSEIDKIKGIIGNLRVIYRGVSFLNIENYTEVGEEILTLGFLLGFTLKEVEQAYLKKHEENYKRQREGY